MNHSNTGYISEDARNPFFMSDHNENLPDEIAIIISRKALQCFTSFDKTPFLPELNCI